MAVYKRGYQRYQGELTPHWRRLLVLPRSSWQRLFRQRLVVVLLSISMIWPLLCAGYIYLASHIDLLQGVGLSRMVEVNAKFFLVFMNAQAFFSVLLAALTGPGLIAPDLANNALPLYFSRPLTRFDYVLGRMTVLVGLLSLVTWLPGLLLFGMQSGMGGWSWFASHLRIGVAVTAGFGFWILIVSLVALASSAYVKWRVIAGALILGFFFFLTGLAEMVDAILRVHWGSLLNPLRSMYIIWSTLLGLEQPAGPEAWECMSMMAALVVALCFILARKLRPVEVIS